jgi:hypothetical protein
MRQVQSAFDLGLNDVPIHPIGKMGMWSKSLGNIDSGFDLHFLSTNIDRPTRHFDSAPMRVFERYHVGTVVVEWLSVFCHTPKTGMLRTCIERVSPLR